MNRALFASTVAVTLSLGSAVLAQEAGRVADPIVPVAPSSAAPPPVPVPAAAPSSAAPPPAPAPPPTSAAAALDATPEAVLVPIGKAAPPTEAATRGRGNVRAGLEVFAQYTARNTIDLDRNSSFFHLFELPRAHAAIEGEYQGAKGRVVLEATRSAAEGALLGVAGDSFVMRVREAYAGYRAFDMLEISAGVVPTLTIPNLDGTWMMRAVAPSVLEQNGLLASADLGARAKLDLPAGYGFLAVGAYNGEGYTSRELNRGKNIEGALEIHPVPRGALAPLGVFASFSGGSTGTTLARANRLVSGLVWQGARVRGGAIFAHAWGLADLGTAKALALSAFVRVEPVDRLYLGARFDHVVRDTVADPLDAKSTVWGTVGYRILDPLEGFVAIARSVPTRRAEDEAPGQNFWDLRVVGRAIF